MWCCMKLHCFEGCCTLSISIFTHIEDTPITTASHFIVALSARLQCLVFVGVKLTSSLKFVGFFSGYVLVILSTFWQLLQKMCCYLSFYSKI